MSPTSFRGTFRAVVYAGALTGGRIPAERGRRRAPREGTQLHDV